MGGIHMNKKRQSTGLLRFLIGIVMLIVGLFWFSNAVTVRTNIVRMPWFNFEVGVGLVLVPFIVGIVMMFFDFDAIWGKIVTGLGILIIIAYIIMKIDFSLKSMSLYSFILILVFIFGGLGMVLGVLLKPLPKDE